MTGSPAFIPQTLTAVNRWLCWRYETKGQKITKMPYAAGGGRASTTDPFTWASFGTALAAAKKYDGVGFVFSAEDDLMGLDLDHCRDADTGVIEPWALSVVRQLDSYTEESPSGTGLHVFLFARLDMRGRKGQRVEVYQQGRYFTMTGKPLPGYDREPERRQAEVEAVVAEFFPKPAAAAPAAPRAGPSGADWEIVDRVRKKPEYDALWRGDFTSYGSQSEADLALCGRIAFFTGPDALAIDRVFRQSGLMREKWDERHGAETYGAMTSGMALAGKSEFYEWRVPATARKTGLDSSSSLNSSRPETASTPLDSSSSLISSAAWPAALDAAALYGTVGEIVNALGPETEADQAALLLNLLVTMGSAVGRSRYFEVGATRHHANLFGCLVGYTGEARKGTSWDPIEYLFERALPEFVAGNQHHGGLASGEGLLSLVRDRREKQVQIKDKRSGRMTMEFETIVEDEGVADKRCLVVETEMAGLLKIMNRPGNVLSQQLCKAWETGTIESISKTNPAKATGAHISVLGHITPDSLKRNLSEADAASGFGNRFLWMLVKRARLLPRGGKLPLLNSQVLAIRELVELASDKFMEIARSPAAEAIWESVYGELVSSGVGMYGEMTARRAPIVMRLALIYSIWDGVRVILPEHLLAALAVWERCEASVRFLYGDSTGDPMADTLYEAMLARPEGAHRTDLHNATGRNRPVAEIDRALTALSRSGRAQMRRQKGDGDREMEVWFALPQASRSEGFGYLEKARAVDEDNEDNESRDVN